MVKRWSKTSIPADNQKLAVPFLPQLGDFDCSIAAVTMVLAYWGDHIRAHQIADCLSPHINKTERHIQAIGIYLAKRGYRVFLCHHDPEVVDNDIANLTEVDLPTFANRLHVLEKSDTARYRLKKLSLDIAYIEAGGAFSNRVPSLNLIDNALLESIPVIICVSRQIWFVNPDERGNHYVVVIGQSNHSYWINDPSLDQASPYKISKDVLLMAWYRAGSYTLIIHPCQSARRQRG